VVSEKFDLAAFGEVVPKVYGHLKTAERELGACGIQLPQPEGWGFFSGRAAPGRRSERPSGDGHRGEEVSRRESTADDNFEYCLSWVVNRGRKAWTIHYHAKQQPLSPEMRSALTFLEFQHFEECPEFDFGPCEWRSISYRGED